MEAAEQNISPYQSRESYEAAVRAAERVSSTRKIIRAKLRNVFGSQEGREVLEWICEQLCGEHRSCFSDNALEMARRCGRAEVAETLRGLVEEEEQ